jgi:hypothetical protein
VRALAISASRRQWGATWRGLLETPRASRFFQVIRRGSQKLLTIKEDLIGVKQSLAQLDRTHSVNFNRPVSDGNDRMPPVEEAVCKRDRAPKDPDPVGFAGKRFAEVCQEPLPTANPLRDSRISLEGIGGVERDQMFLPIARPSG